MLECSLVLTDADLLEIVAGAPANGSLAAISRRPRVAGPVADAISDTGDAEAIAALLANPSTQIREETLDSIIERAVDVESWHLPLVNRPKLPAPAALRLARFVARSLLETMTERKDLDPDTALAVAAEVRKRLDEEHAAEPAADAVAKLEGESPLEAARRLLGEGKLDQAAVAQILETGDGDFVMAALAVPACSREAAGTSRPPTSRSHRPTLRVPASFMPNGYPFASPPGGGSCTVTTPSRRSRT